MIIVCDIDGVLNNLMEKSLELYNSRNNKDIQIADITTYNFFDCLPCEDAKGIISLFREKRLWDSLKPLDGSQKVIKQLIKNGHKIYLATATDPINFEWKVEWLKQYFPSIPSDNIIRIMDKSLLKCDILIDDCLDNLTSVTCERVLIDQPWNQSNTKDYAYGIWRIFEWCEIPHIINEIERKMKEWEK